MAGPRVLLSTAAFFARPLAATFELAAECGYTGVEVMVTKDPASQSASVMRDLAAEHGLWIGALHAPALLLTRSVWGKDPIGKIDTATRVASTAKVPLVVMHPPYRWQGAYRRWLLGSLAPREGGTGITRAVGEMFPRSVRPPRRTAGRARTGGGCSDRWPPLRSARASPSRWRTCSPCTSARDRCCSTRTRTSTS